MNSVEMMERYAMHMTRMEAYAKDLENQLVEAKATIASMQFQIDRLRGDAK